ncbi:MAG: methionine--tRNA ligase subunit beta [Planctomycetota bacterium]|jgi:methionyl-tRNA synthetase
MAQEISFDEFKRADLRIALIKSVEPHPNADKLYVIKLDVGTEGEKQTCAGLKPWYEPDELVGKKVAVVLNLAPAKMRGEISETMLLAGEDGDVVAILTPEKDLAPGSKVV